MDLALLNNIKRLTLIALASDDELMEALVLKGGNAIDLISLADRSSISRTSYDLDFSIINGDFDEDELQIAERIKKTLIQTFLENEYMVIDYKFFVKPKKINHEIADFWGGYKVEFKVLKKEKYDEAKGNLEKQRKTSVPLKPDHSPVFELEFSKFEFVGEKKEINIDGFTIYVYTPAMIVFEKLRAICQQLPQYKNVIKSFNSKARARDFYDIHLIMEMHRINPYSSENIELIKNIFFAKKVPTNYMKEIRNYKFIHSDDWKSVVDTLSPSEDHKDFDFYFNFVVDTFEKVTFP